jgi:hypothetical protein
MSAATRDACCRGADAAELLEMAKAVVIISSA